MANEAIYIDDLTDINTNLFEKTSQGISNSHFLSHSPNICVWCVSLNSFGPLLAFITCLVQYRTLQFNR